MRFKIAHNLPQRLIVRCGKYVFTRNEGYGIENFLLNLQGIENVKTNYANGSIIVNYKEPMTAKNLIKTLKAIDIDEIGEKEPNQNQLIESTNQDFYFKIAQMITTRFGVKTFLPWPLQIAYLLNKYSKILGKGIKSLISGKLNLEVLDATAIGLSFARGDIGTAGSIMFLLAISDQLESYTRIRAKTELSESLALHVEDCWVLKDGVEEEIPLERVALGDTVIVRTGSIIPVDGTISKGMATVNEASMTGEPLPRKKEEGHTVYAGTVVEDGEIYIITKAIASDTKLSNIIEQIDHGDALKAMIQQRNENLADRFVPFNLGLALGTFLLTRNATKAISLLMVDYSCAIKLSTPIVVISSIKEASEMGIIVKGGKFMERFANADAIVFDKTGTLTEARPEVKEVLAFGNYTEKEVLKISACLEEHFPHSVARAIVRKAESQNLKHREEHSEVEYVVAHGIASKLHGEKALIGSHHFVIEDEKIKISKAAESEIEKRANGLSTIYLGIGEEVVGAILIEDPLRKEAKSVVNSLRSQGFDHIAMLTGDGDKAAKSVADVLDLDYYRAEVLPEDKSEYIKKLQDEGKKTIMIGDGINDSPALALSDVSVSLKDSSDIAREVADITLLRDDLNQLTELRSLSQMMLNRIDNNLKTIIGFNSGLMLLGLFGFMSPTSIAILHNASTVLISSRSMRPLI
ncbi:MAG: heavy metal translocating P-type ATPase [Tissierellia bacterium]|nr:heavy metal translocating P-type ATPase [Tissierellia bacterium]